MARIRSIKPDMRRSLTVSAWPYPVRWTFVGLPGYLDDYGRGLDDTRLIKAELYPLDDDMTPRKLETHLRQIADTGPLCRYEIDGRRYMHITSWTEHQKPAHPTASKVPPCPIHDKLANDSRNAAPDTDESRANNSRNAPESFSPSRAPAEQGAGNREQGNREQGAGNAPDDIPAIPRIVNAWLRHAAKPPPGSVVDKIANRLGHLLREGIHPDDLEAGVLAWSDKGLDATKLDSVVNEVMNRRPHANGRGTTKALGWLTVDQPTTPAIEGRPA